MDWQTHLQRLERAGLDLMPGHDDACDLIEVWVDLDSWQAAGHWLTILARRFSGDQFVVWRYPGLQGEPPVVFLGDGSPELVADSVSDFFRLLATGRTWGFGWHHTHLEPREERAIAALAKAVAKSVGALQGTPEEAHQRAVARHPTFAVEMAKHPPCDEPIEMERSVYRPWWYSDTPPELAGCQVPHEAGDRALALELAEPKLTEHTAPEVISAVGSIANELGDREAALRVYRLVPGFDADVWRALAELGRSDEAAAEVAAKMSSPDTRAFDADRLVDTLQRYAGEAFDALMLQVDRQAAPWKGLVPPLDSGAPARRRRAVAAEAAERVTKWPLGSVAVRLMEAEAALDDHDPDGAREILSGLARPSDLAERREALEAALQAYQAPEAGDPMEALFAAWRGAQDEVRGEAAAQLGIALVQADRKAEAWAPLEDAAMNLAGSHALTPRVFELVDTLDGEGFAPA